MKTIQLFIAFSLLSFLTSNAQITKGNWMVGGSGSFSSKENYQNKFENSSKVKFNELDINANLGYFFIDKLQAGIRFGYSNYSFKTFEGRDMFNLKYGVFTRYYFLNPNRMVNIYIDGSYFLGKNSISSGDIQDNLSGYLISAGPTIFLNNSVAIEMGINYSSTNIKGTNDVTENNLQFSLGFQIFLEKK